MVKVIFNKKEISVTFIQIENRNFGLKLVRDNIVLFWKKNKI